MYFFNKKGADSHLSHSGIFIFSSSDPLPLRIDFINVNNNRILIGDSPAFCNS